MKRMLPMTVIVFLAFSFFSSCRKSDSGKDGNENFSAKVSFTIDGDNFHKQIITIQGAPKTTTQCAYSSNDKTTMVTINDQTNINAQTKNQFFLIFNGNTTDTQHSGDDTNGGSFNSIYFQVSVTDKDGVLHLCLFENTDNTPGVFTITQYGKAGETVAGNFSGILVDEDGDPVIKISGGSFSITLGKDIN
jgi:hypothetical protein